MQGSGYVARMDVTLTQESANAESGVREYRFFDAERVVGSHSVSGGPTALPPENMERTRLSLENGLVLVVSLWSADDLSWLDGGCEAWLAQGRPKCDIKSASFKMSNLRTSTIPSPPPPPTPPPSPPPPPPPPLPPPPMPPPPPSLLNSPALYLLVGLLLIVLLTLWLVNKWLRRRAVDTLEYPPGIKRRSRQSRAKRAQIPTAIDEDEDEDDWHAERRI